MKNRAPIAAGRVALRLLVSAALAAAPVRLAAATAELSISIMRGTKGEPIALGPVHTGETVLFTVFASNSGAVESNAVIDLVFPQEILPSRASGSGFSCALTSRTQVTCKSTAALVAGSPRVLSVTAGVVPVIPVDSKQVTISAKIDPGNKVPEADERNNAASEPVTVATRGPDLAAGSQLSHPLLPLCNPFSADPNPFGSDPVYDIWKTRVENRGDRDSEATKVRLTISGGGFLDCSSLCIGCHTSAGPGCTVAEGVETCPVGPLTPGGFQDLSFTVVRGTTTYRAHFEVDPDHAQKEFDETNNAIDKAP